jgi:integrase
MARTGEARGAKWEEVDFQEKKWTVPGCRMKGGKEHCVPLCASAISLLDYLKGNNELMEVPSVYVFPGRTEGTSLSSAACAEFLKRIGRTDITTHGMRSSARTWSAETQDFPREVCEAALAHQLRDRVEAAYMRSTLFAKRIQLMEAWGAFCHSEQFADVRACAIPVDAGTLEAEVSSVE